MSRNIVPGGKKVYGASVGILRLQAEYPRIIGDIGNAETWPFPVHYRTVKGATPDKVVCHRAEGLVEAFIEEAKELVKLGADGIATTCGFLSLFQNELAEAIDVPVASSSLLQYALIQSLLPKSKKVGIVTISSQSLSDEHLAAAGVPLDAPIVGTDEAGSEFSRVILTNEGRLDVALAEQDLVRAAKALLIKDPEVGAILLECTNMAPYSASIGQATGLPVFDMYSFICWFQASLSPRRFLERYR